MKTITSIAGLLLACSAFAASNPKASPAYDRSSETKFVGKVVDVQEVAKDQALPGVHLAVKTEKGENLNVYVGPADFIKLFDVSFKAGQEVEVLGSKVQFEGGEIYLAREIRMGQVTLVLRDETGAPNWTWMRPAIPTGL